MVAEVGVVACNDKQRVVIPWLFPCLFEEEAQGVVGITYALVYHYAFFLKHVLILLRHLVRMV